jgi:hypothetical protein
MNASREGRAKGRTGVHCSATHASDRRAASPWLENLSTKARNHPLLAPSRATRVAAVFIGTPLPSAGGDLVATFCLE